MVAGMERYYQIARCYRDEDFRADRQPEFTQLDIEMSFVEQDDVIALTEEILTALWALIGYDVPTPLPRLTYAEAMARFGTDKPDLRMGLELVECTEFFSGHPVPRLPGAVRRCRGDARWSRPAAQAARRLAGVGQAARRPWPGLPPRQGGRRAQRTGGEEHQRRGAGRHRRARRRRARGLHLLRRRSGQEQPGPARRRPARDRPPRRPDRRGRLELPLGRRRAAVRAGRGGDRRRRRRRRRRAVDRRAPRVHQPQGPRAPSTRTPATRWRGPTTSSATATRSAVGRSVSTAATSRSGSSR